ncbi:MAG: hypothetical protein V4565_06825 [Bacteroidota bacterium]
MKLKLYICFFVLLFASWEGQAQDKVFLRDGKIISCKIVAISEKTISYRDTSINANLVTLSKNEVLLTEYQSGTIYMFNKVQAPELGKENNATSFSSMPDMNETREQRKERKMNEWKKEEALLPNGILGFYIPEIAFGRLTISYERLIANKSMGIKIPLSLTYDGLGFLAENSSNTNTSSTNTNTSGTNTNTSNNNNTNSTPVKRNRGTGFITGIDINYYHDLKPKLKYYFGPRIRYGTDMTLGGIEGLTFQLQNGIFKSNGKKMTSTLGFGVGFFKLSAKYANRGAFDTKQVYPWASFTWRLGFRL